MDAAHLIVTDLDGTLLDFDTYSLEPARPALEELAQRGLGLVLASSKTRSEMEPLAHSLPSPPALIVENGGAVLVPRRAGGYETLVTGIEHSELLRHLGEISRETGLVVRGFSSFSAGALARRAGLSVAAAARALEREHDEPFLLADEGDLPRLSAAAARRGLRVSRGGRFFHLSGDTDKGRALGHLLAARGDRPGTVGLGDAENDLPLLRVVDRPILMPGRDGRLDPALAMALPAAERAPAPGPAGWNAAVSAVLAGERLPTVGDGGVH